MNVAIGYNWFVQAAGFHVERALRALGHTVVYVGLAGDRRAGYDHRLPLPAILAALPEQPDLFLWIDPAGPYFPRGIEDLPIPTACYLIDVHLGTWRREAAKFFDFVFVAQKDYVAEFRAAVGHGQVCWLPLAAAPDVHRPWDVAKVYDVGFVGNVAAAHRHTNRARRLKLIAARYQTNDFYAFYRPEEVGQIYSQSRIVFNTSIAGDVTMRVFEGTASGALVLTDAVNNGLNELFRIGEEIVTYRDDADLLAKIDHYLMHEDERARVARLGYERTVQEHTYLHRCQSLLTAISAGAARTAPMRRAPERERWPARRSVYTHLHMLEAIMDHTREAGYSPLRRAWAIAPCLARRLLL